MGLVLGNLRTCSGFFLRSIPHATVKKFFREEMMHGAVKKQGTAIYCIFTSIIPHVFSSSMFSSNFWPITFGVISKVNLLGL